MGDADVPAFLHRDLDHLVQLGIADIALRVHAVDGFHQLAQAQARRAGPVRDRPGFDLDLAHHGARDALVDRLFRIEKAIDVGRTHPQHLGDVGDRGLLVADLAEQTLRRNENAFPCVGFDMFRNQRHGSAQPSVLNVQLFRRLGKRKCGTHSVLMLRRKTSLRARPGFFKAVPEPERVEPRQVQQGQEGCNKQAAHDGDGHRTPERRAR